VLKLGALLRDRPASGTNDGMKSQILIIFSQSTERNWPPALRRMLAGLVLDRILKTPQFMQTWSGNSLLESAPVFGTEFVTGFRARNQYFLDQWLSVANAYLEQHRTLPYSPDVLWVIQSLDLALKSYSEGDDWPAEKTAALLSDELRGYYTDDPTKTTNHNWRELVPAEPATLLTEIVAITGKIPDFVRNGHPKPASVAARLRRLEALLKADKTHPAVLAQDSAIAGLIALAPYQVIKLVNKFCIPREGPRRGDPSYILGGTPANRIDPRLLLATLADLAGEDQAQDERIAGLFTNPYMKNGFRIPLENLLSGPLKARGTARRQLQKMAATARSPELIKVIRDLDPTLVPPKS